MAIDLKKLKALAGAGRPAPPTIGSTQSGRAIIGFRSGSANSGVSHLERHAQGFSPADHIEAAMLHQREGFKHEHEGSGSMAAVHRYAADAHLLAAHAAVAPKGHRG